MSDLTVTCSARGLGTLHKAKSKKNIQLFLLALPALLQLLIFSYLPMVGIVLSFKKFNVAKGFWKSDWVGLDNFKFFFISNDAARVLRNTLLLNILFIVIGTCLSIIFALLLFEIVSVKLVKFFQTVFVTPALISWVVVGFVSYVMLQPEMGVVNKIIRTLGGEGISWYSEPAYWPWILLFFSVWKGLGMSSLYYYATLMGIESDVFEAARIDGANRIQMSLKISLPFLVPTIIILTILHIGNIFRSDFGLFYNITQDVGALYSTTDVIDTYIYRTLSKIGNIGMSSAVGLFQSAVGFVLILITNIIVRRIDKDSALF